MCNMLSFLFIRFNMLLMNDWEMQFFFHSIIHKYVGGQMHSSMA